MRKRTLFFYLLLLLTMPGQAQDPDIEANEQDALEHIFRSSELDGERPTAARERRAGVNKRMSAPTGARRIGCQCMDDTRSTAHSTGACSGRGGVRYWIYRTVNGDTVQVLTGRHEQHPQPLDSVERSAVNPPVIPRTPRLPGMAGSFPAMLQPLIITTPATPLPYPPAGDGWFDWSDAATISGGGFTLFLSLRLLLRWLDAHQPLVRYALRNLLRFGKRPPPRPRRKTPAKKGL